MDSGVIIFSPLFTELRVADLTFLRNHQDPSGDHITITDITAGLAPVLFKWGNHSWSF